MHVEFAKSKMGAYRGGGGYRGDRDRNGYRGDRDRNGGYRGDSRERDRYRGSDRDRDRDSYRGSRGGRDGGVRIEYLVLVVTWAYL